MQKFTEQQIYEICFKVNPLKATANFPRCPFPRKTIKGGIK